MSTRDYEGWRRYGQWKKEQYENYQKQMSDREIMNAKNIRPVKLKNIDQMPDQKWHRRISFIKSGIRILGYILIPFDLLWAAGILVVSEVVGIIEELV